MNIGRNNSTWMRGLVVLIATLALCSCGSEPVVEQAPVIRPVKTMVVGGYDGAGERNFPGRVVATNQVDLSFRVGGPLITFPVVEGDWVRKGQVVTRIDPRDFEIALTSARAEFERARADFERMAALYEKEAIPETQLDQARAARDMAAASVENAEANLADTSLRAPFGGLVGATFVENFQDVRPRERVLSLVDVSRLKIEVDIPELIMARAREGMEVGLVARFEAAPEREFELTVEEVATQADPATQTYRATLGMETPKDLTVLPGMTATVVLTVAVSGEGEAASVIPAAAIFADENKGTFLWVVDRESMTVSRRAVTTGQLTGSDRISIVDGLEPGEMIAVSAVSRLEDGMEIRSLNE
jgi:multidrug efflux system membrane fusion protein